MAETDTSSAGRIQIAASTRQMVEPWFELEPRGIVELRGRGEMETWFLVGPARA